MVNKQNYQISFWERTLTAIALTLLVWGCYKLPSPVYPVPYEIFEHKIFHEDIFYRKLEDLKFDRLPELAKISVIKM